MHRMENGICQICGHGAFHDDADGTIYKVVRIGNMIMMAENFRREPSKGNFWIYEDREENLAKFGYLYDWETARVMAPKGWHLPTKEELDNLITSLGGDSKKVYPQLKSGGESGFESLFGGERFARGAFNNLGASANFWSATEDSDKNVWYLKVGAYTETVSVEKVEPGFGLSVRYFRD